MEVVRAGRWQSRPDRTDGGEGHMRPFPGDALGGADLQPDRRQASEVRPAARAHRRPLSADGVRYAWGSWGAILEPDSGTSVLATYADQFYAGKAAAVTRK